MNSYLSQGHWCEVKCKQPCQRFEFDLLSLFLNPIHYTSVTQNGGMQVIDCPSMVSFQFHNNMKCKNENV